MPSVLLASSSRDCSERDDASLTCSARTGLQPFTHCCPLPFCYIQLQKPYFCYLVVSKYFYLNNLRCHKVFVPLFECFMKGHRDLNVKPFGHKFSFPEFTPAMITWSAVVWFVCIYVNMCSSSRSHCPGGSFLCGYQSQRHSKETRREWCQSLLLRWADYLWKSW